MKFNLYCTKGNNTNKIIKTMEMMLKTILSAGQQAAGSRGSSSQAISCHPQKMLDRWRNTFYPEMEASKEAVVHVVGNSNVRI